MQTGTDAFIKLLTILTTVLMIAAGSSKAVMASVNTEIEFIDKNGCTQYCTEYQLLDTAHIEDSPETVLEAGWYVVRENAVYKNRLTVEAPFDLRIAEECGLEPVHIILCDGCTLTLEQGINLNTDNGLMIYGQSGGSGVLNATYRSNCDYDDDSHAVIGGNAPRGRGGFLSICGGVINVYGETAGACIGGSGNGALDEVNIYGGKVRAENAYGGPAIGVGLSYQRGSVGTVNITGGDVYVDSHYRTIRTCDAIGGHYECSGLSLLNITGGRVTAFGRYATVGMNPCSMITYGTISLGENMTVRAGFTPESTILVSNPGERAAAIRSYPYSVVEEKG